MPDAPIVGQTRRRLNKIMRERSGNMGAVPITIIGIFALCLAQKNFKHMKEIPEDRQIYISGRVWHEIMNKVNFTPFIYVLHDKLDLSAFGEGLTRFYFTFIIVKPDDQINVPYAHFNKNNKSADIAIAIPYHLYDEAPEKEAIELLEHAYLEGVDKLNELPIKDFDVMGLKNTVELIFAQDNWYERVEEEV
jgi:hypothetical protein